MPMKMTKTSIKQKHKAPVAASRPKCLFGALATAAVLPMAVPAARAADASSPPPPPPSPLSHVDALVNFEFADKYLTPRGMIVHDKGLTFQSLVLGLVNVYKGDGFINDVTLVPASGMIFSSSGFSVQPRLSTASRRKQAGV